ncbi:MAG: VOC family protein [Erythrobacter sp.]|uniref:VOC family protein n=1 Tax=Erythrobacter sp. TaxID=1042 RepID=UPI002620851C|nr:VOC family protein [Erythrobacter sp.]MDJ0979190.1 VOC family protein [Erythrobacter sp.]
MTTLGIATVTLVVPDYEAGIAFYRDKLGFDLVHDTELGGGKRWVMVAPDSGAQLLLAQASDEKQRAAIGNQTGGRVSFFLHTDNFADTHARFTAAGVTFLESPRTEPYGTVAVFSDPFGNRWDLIEPKAQNND